jgi:Fic-DOC domain mobile mystery protein B
MITDMHYPEGATPLDPNELGGLKHKHITTQGELDQLEQANIESGLQWLSRQRAHVLTDDFVVTLHKRLFGDVWDWAGMFRRTGKSVGIDAIHIPVELRTLMGDAKFWADNRTYPGSEAALRLHHRLVKIHPWPSRSIGRADTISEKLANVEPPILRHLRRQTTTTSSH